ncbi:AAA family ATPase [Alienimonas sp. DA493]|uniref:AAA family ATPase n=1 Tax=Alienimonas sp. DA493 TaxID=3373605 RepID=UPI003754CB2E
MPAALEPPPAVPPEPATELPAGFFPTHPESLEETGLPLPEIEALVLKILLNRGPTSGRDVARQIRLPGGLVAGYLRDLKKANLVTYRRNAGPDDYLHELTEPGLERASRAHDRSRYDGCAPAPLEQYVASVAAQSLRNQTIRRDRLRAALTGLQVSAETFGQLGAALGSVGALFLYGDPGNGKTTIAERLTRVYDEELWIPRAVRIGGETVRLYDPAVHEELPAPEEDAADDGPPHDDRWVRVRRPTVAVGGELTMEHLELSMNTVSGVMEAPVQLKANGGTLVVDDFGRQRIPPDELLNRWIVPLERGYDFLNTPGGKKAKVPFDLLTVFATNLRPADLVDEAFLRRIPFKVRVGDPSPEEFRAILHALAPTMDLRLEAGAAEALVTEGFLNVDRPMRFCHPRDLLLQVKRRAAFEGLPPVATAEAFAVAVRNYFADL